MKTINLGGNWTFCKRGGEQMPAVVPGCNYSDLLRLGKIEDPFVGENEAKCLWVGETDWDYFCTFNLSEEDINAEKLLLSCARLDTLCRVYLNGKLVGSAENVHIAYEFDIKSAAKSGENLLKIEFDAPVSYIKEAIKTDKTPRNNQGLTGLTQIRKAQCHFGWDWGPVIPVSGVTGEICIKAISGARLSSLDVTQQHIAGRAEVYVVAVAEKLSGEVEIKLTLKDPDGAVISEEACKNGALRMETMISDPRLWWTNDLAEEKIQPLYTVTAEIYSNGELVDKKEKRIGLRILELDRKADKWGENFRFILNGVPIFAKGGNYIPMDSLVDRITDERKRELLENCVNANMNMIRVWGGGFYESDSFYDMCDEMGILVWQDFMFACAPYPFYNEKFLANVKREVEYNVKRLRHHASLAIWCGNNEIEAMEIGWKAYTKLVKWTPKFFYDILPKWVAALDESTPFINTSPTGNGYQKNVGSDDVGDTHLWQVWHGLMPLTFYRKRYTRFCSEFGLESMPSMKTIRYFAEPKDYSLTGKVFNAHQKSPSGNKKMYYYIASRYRIPEGFEDLLYLSQLIQQEGVRDATEHWRRNRGRCNGSIYWQLNDCWPVCSWAGIDYLGMNKAVQFAAKKFNAPLTVSVEDSDKEFKVYVVNDTVVAEHAELECRVCDFSGKEVTSFKCSVLSDTLSSELIKTFSVAELTSGHDKKDLWFSARLIRGGEVISERIHLFTAEKYANLPEAEIKSEVELVGEEARVTLKSDKFARHVMVESELTRGNFSDNFMDILPGEPRILTVKAAEGATAESIKNSLKFTSVSNIKNNKSILYGRWTQFKIKMIPINFVTWIGHVLGIG